MVRWEKVCVVWTQVNTVTGMTLSLIFQQDNDLKHASQLILIRIKTSSEFSPIKNMWTVFKSQVCVRKHTVKLDPETRINSAKKSVHTSFLNSDRSLMMATKSIWSWWKGCIINIKCAVCVFLTLCWFPKTQNNIHAHDDNTCVFKFLTVTACEQIFFFKKIPSAKILQLPSIDVLVLFRKVHSMNTSWFLLQNISLYCTDRHAGWGFKSLRTVSLQVFFFSFPLRVCLLRTCVRFSKKGVKLERMCKRTQVQLYIHWKVNYILFNKPRRDSNLGRNEGVSKKETEANPEIRNASADSRFSDRVRVMTRVAVFFLSLSTETAAPISDF